MDIERDVRGAPLLQVAVDGWWEDAATVELPAVEEAGRLLEGLSGSDVAVEVLWPGPPIVFVGARFGSVRRPPLRRRSVMPVF